MSDDGYPAVKGYPGLLEDHPALADVVAWMSSMLDPKTMLEWRSTPRGDDHSWIDVLKGKETTMSELDQIGLEGEEMIEEAIEIVNQAIREFEDDGKIDAKEGILLAAMFVDGIANRVNDQKVKFLMKGVAMAVKGIAKFVSGDGLETGPQEPPSDDA